MGRAQADQVYPAADSLAAMASSPGANTGAIQASIQATEAASLKDALNGAGDRSSDALTYGMYMSRNKTISDIASQLTYQNYQVENGPGDTYARQGEINEWQAQNKFDTLFFLQCLFIYLTAFILLLFLRRYDILTMSMFYILSGILTAIIIGIFWNRAAYTEYARDTRYWNRRYIGINSSTTGSSCQPSTTVVNNSGYGDNYWDTAPVDSKIHQTTTGLAYYGNYIDVQGNESGSYYGNVIGGGQGNIYSTAAGGAQQQNYNSGNQ